jgi:hypothetical protein
MLSWDDAMIKRLSLVLTLLMVFMLAIGGLVRAQDAVITGVEPSSMVSGTGGTLTVLGQNFGEGATVRLVGFGLLSTSRVSASALTANVPPVIGPGVYGIEVIIGTTTVASPIALTVSPAPVAPQPTVPPLVPTPTNAPTVVPGQPSLVVRSFVATPTTIPQGGTVTFEFEIVNQGNRPAQGISVTLNPDSRFSPAGGQSSLTAPDLLPGSVVRLSLSAIAREDAPAGPNNVTITMAYRDFEGKTYTTNGVLTVQVQDVNLAARVVVAQYRLDPTPVVPGERTRITLTLQNQGNTPALQVLLRVSGEGGLLIPDSGGDSFSFGDLQPSDVVDVTFTMIVRGDARRGPQAQPIVISYLQDGETQTVNTSIGIEVAAVVTESPVILLESIDTGGALLEPGKRFTLSFVLQNVGQADAEEMLVTFGTLDVSNNPPPPQSTPSGSSSPGGGTSTTTTPSTVFAPIGSGNTVFAGDLPAGETMTLTQEFVVNLNVESGIQTLPITVRYTSPQGDTGQTVLPASLVVVVPPRLQVDLAEPLPETVNQNEPFPVSLQVTNLGRSNEIIDRADVGVEGGDVIEGRTAPVGVIRPDDDATINALVVPTELGRFGVTFTLVYTDDLGVERSLEYPFAVEVVEAPPPPPIVEQLPDLGVTPVPQAEEDDLLGRLLLGFLGLGG